jgi:hypothetical protein
VSSLTEAELIDVGLVSLAETFGLPAERIRRDLVASRAINWGNDPFARGAYNYSYATPKTRDALAVLRRPGSDGIFFSGGALRPPKNGVPTEGSNSLPSANESVQFAVGVEVRILRCSLPLVWPSFHSACGGRINPELLPHRA